MKLKRRYVQLVLDIFIRNALKVIVIVYLQRPPFWRARKICFCNSINYPPWRCLKISNPQHKRTMLKGNGLCFICFHKRHMASSCTLSNYSCNKCKGKYDISICIESKRTNDKSNTGSSGQSNTANMDKNNTNPTERTTNNFTSYLTNNVNNVLLQTS